MSALVRCALCERLEPADLIDHVDVLAGLTSVPVCHGCAMGHGAAMLDLAANVAVDRLLDESDPLDGEVDPSMEAA